MARTGPVAEVPVTDAKPARHQSWSPPSREEFMARLDEALTGAGDRQYRTNLGLQCWTFMDRVWSRRTSAVHARSQWNLELPRVFRTREFAVILRGCLHFQVLIHGLLRSTVPECGVKALPIVAQLDVARDVLPCFLACRVDGPVNAFDFQRAIE